MNRSEIFDKIEEIKELTYSRNIGLNEGELDFKETLTDWLLPLLKNNGALGGVSVIYVHLPTGNYGTLVKEYTPTGRSLTLMIKIKNGREYFAPEHEFKKIEVSN